MDFNTYQEKALQTAIYPMPIIYPALALNGESGEIAEKVKKVLRDNDGVFDNESKKSIAKEIGDVLWYCAALSEDLGFSFDDIALMNLNKLKSRKDRDKLHGNGDNR